MFVRVEISAQGQPATTSQVDGSEITLGRDPNCQVPFDGVVHSAVSWQHARIELSPRGAIVKDLGSSNGTFVNGNAVKDRKSIQPGDVIGLGQTGPKVRVVEIGGLPPLLPATRVEKMLPDGMLTPPPPSKVPINVSSDAIRIPLLKRRTLPVAAIALGVVAVLAVVAAGYVVLLSQRRANDDKKDDVIAEAKKPNERNSPKVIPPEGQPPENTPPAKIDPEPPITPPEPKEEPKKIDVAVTPKVEPPPPASTGAEIYQRTLQSTGWVTIQNNPPVIVMGTGALVDAENKLFLTAHHVVEGAREAKIYFPRFDDDNRPISERSHYLKNEKPVIGDVIVSDSKRDLAVLRLRSIPEGVKPLPLASKGIGIAHRIYTVGNPGVSSVLWTYTEGSVRQIAFKKFRMDNKQDVEAWMIEAQFPINQGDSGGPVVNDRNELVGVNCSLNSKAQLMSNCVDLREIVIVLDRARRVEGSPSKGRFE